MNKLILLMICLGLLFPTGCLGQKKAMKNIIKNGMEVSWYHLGDRVYFEMKAPTDGWVAIGFNTSENIQGASLLMGHVMFNHPDVVEYYTLSPGNYKPISELGATTRVLDVEGFEEDKKTVLKFSIPIIPQSKYQKDLSPGMEYIMVIAYSRDDDFRHHSMMRSSVKIEL